MRRPDESFSRDFDRSFCVEFRFRYVLSAERLVLMDIPMVVSSVKSGSYVCPSVG
jgi:hypothetical protein